MENSIKKTVLLVDDEQDLLTVLSQRFVLMGFYTIVAEGGHAAFDIIQSGTKIDLVVTDVKMPEGDGFELLDRIRKLNVHIPVVFITGFLDQTEAEAYDRGADGLYTKPMGTKKMVEHAKRLLSPYEERWVNPLAHSDCQCVNLKFKNRHSKLNQGLFELGRGGMALKMPEKLLSSISEIKFNIEFETGEIKKIAGDGIIRWMRDSLPTKTLGVEFSYIQNDVREALIRFLRGQNNKPFIPLI